MSTKKEKAEEAEERSSTRSSDEDEDENRPWTDQIYFWRGQLSCDQKKDLFEGDGYGEKKMTKKKDDTAAVDAVVVLPPTHWRWQGAWQGEFDPVSLPLTTPRNGNTFDMNTSTTSNAVAQNQKGGKKKNQQNERKRPRENNDDERNELLKDVVTHVMQGRKSRLRSAFARRVVSI